MNAFYKTLFILLLTVNVYAQNSVFQKIVFVEHNDSLPYRLLYPVNYNPEKKYPLVLFLHGSGARGNDNEKQLKNVPQVFLDSLNRIRYPCFILVPQCSEKDTWVMFPAFPKSIAATDTPTIAARLTLTLIERLRERLSVDKNRIYITGISMGGEGTFDFLMRKPFMFAAAIPLCAVADTNKAEKIKHILMWIFHGDEDPVNDVKYARMMVAALKRVGGNPTYTEYKGVKHNCWIPAYTEPNLLPWLFAQKKE